MFKNLFKSYETTALTNKVQNKEIPAEVIHAEVDAQEEIFLNQVKAILNKNDASKVEIEEKVKNKSDLMRKLGFTNAKNEINLDVTEKTKLNERLASENEQLNKSIDLFQQYKNTYPLDKIIPFEMFDTVLKKYNLIYSPSQAYIKDVPEKNLLEISNAKKTNNQDFIPNLYVINNVELKYSTWDLHSKTTRNDAEEVENFINQNPDVKFLDVANIYTNRIKSIAITKDKNILNNHDIYNLIDNYFDYDYSRPSIIKFIEETYKVYSSNLKLKSIQDLGEDFKRYSSDPLIKIYPLDALENMGKIGKIFKENKIEYISMWEEKVFEGKEITEKQKNIINEKIRNKFGCTKVFCGYTEVKRDCLFIAAPKSHFDLKSLETVNGLAYYYKTNVNVKIIQETKDPIAFNILGGNEKYPNGFVRILSKWGTEDDQSYIDPIVQNENLN